MLHSTLRLASCRQVDDPHHPFRQVALRGLCLSVRPGERLGLLGENGAGKSTLMAILTGRLSMTGGDAVLGGVSIQATRGCGRGLGYCPQVDPLNDHMTAIGCAIQVHLSETRMGGSLVIYSLLMCLMYLLQKTTGRGSMGLMSLGLTMSVCLPLMMMWTRAQLRAISKQELE